VVIGVGELKALPDGSRPTARSRAARSSLAVSNVSSIPARAPGSRSALMKSSVMTSVHLEYEQGVPRNPFINAGSIVVTDILLANAQPREAIGATVRFVRSLADDEAIFVDKAVAKSETETGFRNMALAAYLKSCGNLNNPVDLTIGTYFTSAQSR
jgi:hypothetical protein